LSTKFLYPRFDNYYSDWHQLTFVLADTACFIGIYSFSEDSRGKVHSQVFALNLSKFPEEILNFNQEWKWDVFITIFKSVWLHEWLHLVGLSERGVDIAKELGFPVA